MMTTKNMVESAWAKDMGQFLYHLDTDTRKITRRLEKFQFGGLVVSLVVISRLMAVSRYWDLTNTKQPNCISTGE